MPNLAIQIRHAIAVIVITPLLIAMSLSSSRAADPGPRFSDYPVPLYQGAIHPPGWIRQGTDGEIRDDLDKLVEPPEINFAGKYFIAVHSCGTSCRYYTLTDLSSGRDLETLSSFASAEPPPRTRDGHTYITILVHRPASRMLVAQYHVELKLGKEECRERVFLFDGQKLKPVTKTRYHCTES